MTHTRQPFSPQEHLAREFAERVATWAHAAGAPDEAIAVVRRAAQAVSLATSEGHVCWDLSEIGPEQELGDVRRLLLTAGVVGTQDAPGAMPLILDGEGRLYLHRYFDYERRLAHRLLAASADRCAVDPNAQAQLSLSFGQGNATIQPDWQKIAVALALRQKLTIISGGPGTGKTSVIVHLLGCLLAQHPDTRIKLAAPTGKAAARMLDTIRERSAILPANIRDRLPEEAFTIHRLLGITSENDPPRHHAGNPLPLDALIIDEASMLDIALTTKLLEAVPSPARIILLGDKDQLSAVESGAVFAEISANPSLMPETLSVIAELTGIPAEKITPPEPVRPAALHDNVVWLSENFRFARDSGIGRLARHINAGQAGDVLTLLEQADSGVQWLADSNVSPSTETIACMMAGYADFLELLRSGSTDLASLFGVFERFRVLCALREGSRGVDGMNEEIGRRFRQALNHPLDSDSRSAWYPGRPVMVLRNDYVLHLFNGDIGIAMPDTTGQLLVHFQDGAGGYRSIAPGRLPEHETAFAMTVHKSQGSEFDEILLLMPARSSRAVTRELLYTAITRARHRAVLVGDQATLEAAIASRTSKRSGLQSRMREMAG